MRIERTIDVTLLVGDLLTYENRIRHDFNARKTLNYTSSYHPDSPSIVKITSQPNTTSIMSASQNQSSLSEARGARTTFGPNDTNPSSSATPGMSVGSATAAGHGQHPRELGDDSNATLPNSRVGPQNEDLDGEQMRTTGEGEVMDAQFNKKDAGWGEQGSLTSDLDRQKAEQKGAREEIQAARQGGADVDRGAGNRVDNEGINSV